MEKRTLGFKTVFAMALSLSVLSGCSLFGDTFRNRNNDYQLAEEAPELKLPESTADGAIAELYPIPAIPDDSLVPGKFSVPRPQRASLAAFEKQVKIQSLGGKSWVLVQASPDRVWPEIRNVLTRNGIFVESLDAKNGLIETIWVNYKEDETYSHRYRLKVEPGVQFNTTEVSVLHNNATKGDERETAWPLQSNDKERERELRRLVAEALAGDIGNSSVSLLAQTIGGEAKVEVVSGSDEQPYVLIKLDYPRSWGSVAYSLGDRDGTGAFSIVDQDRSAGIFYVRHKELDEKGGWFSGWFSSDDDKQSRRVDYHVTATQVDTGVQVRIANPDGSLLDPNDALRLLKEIRGNLS
ncbi:outer membrane protein assembly factor BamC [bacterium SCSIO 12696]|nr:outer membrane protein assembly factor BamC [bacterium SCSIO 12696]